MPQIARDYKKNNGLSAVNKCTKLKIGLEIVNDIETAIKDDGIEYWIKHDGR